MKSRIEKEKKVVEVMIYLYCRKKERNFELCESCVTLLNYAVKRLDNCPFGMAKSSCRRCKIHCYSPAMKEKVKEVMRFSGPRLFFYYPLESIRHLIK